MQRTKSHEACAAWKIFFHFISCLKLMWNIYTNPVSYFYAPAKQAKMTVWLRSMSFFLRDYLQPSSSIWTGFKASWRELKLSSTLFSFD
jgi:hypothetical protein